MELKDLEKEIENIKIRNARVELDKKWKKCLNQENMYSRINIYRCNCLFIHSKKLLKLISFCYWLYTIDIIVKIYNKNIK